MHPFEYRDLMKAFVSGQINTDEFEARYFEAFQEEDTDWGYRIFEVLQTVVEAVDSYSADCSPEDEDIYTITEATLRKEVNSSLAKLEQILKDYPKDYTNVELHNLRGLTASRTE
jgi:Bacterial self-protective colicin-like immunity